MRTGTVVSNMRMQALDDVPTGIIRVNDRQEIQYANRAAQGILGPHGKPGTRLSAVPMDDPSRKRIEAAFEQRRLGQGSAYQVTLLDPRWGTQKLVEVTGVPEYDDDGQFTGSLAFLRNLSFEAANGNIHRAIEESATWPKLLERVAAELHKVIPYDSFLVTLVSQKGGHLRSLFEDPPFLQTSPIRWWPMPPFIRAMLRELEETSTLSVEEMLQDDDYRRMREKDANFRSWIERGFKHLLRRPVLHNGKQAAVVVLQRKDPEPFTAEDIRTFDQLPIAEAIDIAIGLDRKAEMQFRLDLIHDLGKVANDADGLRSLLVERLRTNYAWEHVSLFRVDNDRKRLMLAAQSAIRGRLLPEDHWQPLDAGLIGEARKSRQAVIEGDVRKIGARYLKAIPDTLSQMCLPVPGLRQRWILNVESAFADAFADEEQHSVESILSVIGFLLERVESIEMKSAIFDSVADGVVFTSKDGVIQRVNPAMQRLLGATEDSLVGVDFATLLYPAGKPRPEAFGDRIVCSRRVSPLRVDIRWKRNRIGVLLSGAALPPGVGGRFFIVSDVRVAERLHQMQALKRVYGAIAAEMRIPLSLACSFVTEIQRQGGEPQELASKALAQLRRADLPLERILRLATLESSSVLTITEVNVLEVLEHIKAQLPTSQADDVQLHAPAETRPAKASYSELAFCIHSIVSYLLRQKAQADAVHIDVSHRQKRIALDFWLSRDDSRRESSTDVAALDTEVREFALADSLLANLMGRMGGKYEPRNAGTPRFRLSLAS